MEALKGPARSRPTTRAAGPLYRRAEKRNGWFALETGIARSDPRLAAWWNFPL